MTKKLPFRVVQHPVNTECYFRTTKGFLLFINQKTFFHFAKDEKIGLDLWMGYIDDPKVASDILWADYCYQTIGEFPK